MKLYGIGLLLLGCLGQVGAEPARAAGGEGGCRRAVVTGEVNAGQGFRHAVMSGLEVRMEPLPSGWVLRIESAGGEDMAEMATPPYRSVSPLLVSTDFAFRAQDAVGWNPRRFRYADGGRSYADLKRLRAGMERGGAGARASELELATVASKQPGGVLEILDARLVPGTADQTAAAGLVAGHFVSTAHRLEQPADGRPSALGRLVSMRFRVTLDAARGARLAEGVVMERTRACEAP